jgi:hypothetical protein
MPKQWAGCAKIVGNHWRFEPTPLRGPYIPEVERACSFLKKRTKRLLLPRGFNDPGLGRPILGRGQDVDVFCVFSSDKEDASVARSSVAAPPAAANEKYPRPGDFCPGTRG